MKDEKDEKNDEDTYDVIPSSPISHFDSRPLTSVTASFTLQMPTPCNFNPRPHTGATHIASVLRNFYQFQSTPPHEGDGKGPFENGLHEPFQSTPPHGGDFMDVCPGDRAPHFNPRPLAGETCFFYSFFFFCRFQSTPPCGGDPLSLRR